MKQILTCVSIVLFSFSVFAHKFETDNLVVKHPWMKISQKNGAGYFKIKNISSEDIHLVKVVSKNVKKIELHEIIIEDDIAKMRPTSGGIIIKAGDMIEFKPMSNHLMFFGINKDYKEGDMMKAKFIFKKLDALDVKFKIDSIKASHKHDH
ncbi:MAG: copper chaperone PCu(A)C [Pelagibacterales bacterium]|nr:copper chaperone PCu(A)C [Pelagibacterales bacterium]MBT4109838.1 copper chaperone PCu(A)C [Pelagibacterales bacterium]